MSNYPPNQPVQPVYSPQPQNIYLQQTSGPGCLIRGLWFVFIGLWLGLIVTGLAWFLVVSIIGLPIGLMLLNRLPQIMTLRLSPIQTNIVTLPNGQVIVQQGHQPQLPMIMRAVYFVLIGWWLSGIWLATAWLLAGITFGLGLPLAFWMFNRVPAITTLGR